MIFLHAIDSSHQWRKAFLLNIAVNCSPTRLKSSWSAVVFPMNVEDIFSPGWVEDGHTQINIMFYREARLEIRIETMVLNSDLWVECRKLRFWRCSESIRRNTRHFCSGRWAFVRPLPSYSCDLETSPQPSSILSKKFWFPRVVKFN